MASESGAYFVAGIEVLEKPITPVDDAQAKYNGLRPSTTVLAKGYQKSPDFRPFEVDTIWERDIEVPTRDGKILRADVFRPAGMTDQKIPAMMAFSPYGKSGTGFFSLDIIPARVGIPKNRLSGFEDFEAPDPAEWCSYGYAVVNVDAQRIFGSEGNHKWHGAAEGRDGYDAVEHVSQLTWCNGRVALVGNSWLASCQWFIAAERPPHLACMLPLEGLSDVYRETLCRGGVPYLPFWDELSGRLFVDKTLGHNLQEDVISMIRKYPLMNGYWEDKRAKAHLIDTPAYVLASMSTALHTVGSIRCFEDIPHDRKWLRIHPTQEWHDLYQRDTIADLKKFLDFYTKGVENGWEQTPKVRVSVIKYNQPPIRNIPFTDWPIPETTHKTFWLSSNNTLQSGEAAVSGEVSYQSDAPHQQVDRDPEQVEFVYTFAETTTLVGPSRVVLYMSCADHDDMDVFVILRKADRHGKVLRNVNIPLEELGVVSEDEVEDLNTLKYIGPSGVLRASHRAIDPRLTKPHWPAHDHTREDKVPFNKVVKLEIGLWPAAIQFDPGEKMILRVAGHQMTLAEFPTLRGGFHTGNKGRHVVHFGGEKPSHLIVPTVRTVR
ncbi:hypothetical protein CLCR_06772 [Cladophialophora carrionii]|uniref:Xaa-Pro dipeptidyl-peptidase C-terminal domain-containing protein n=1 Tax=Cladophialophora carrionii TaxID=86049 RepID=A0A1C1CP06_9EURO|nr:hypothetical protein CLCR_06772 [Cladophialophora carrionii]